MWDDDFPIVVNLVALVDECRSWREDCEQLINSRKAQGLQFGIPEPELSFGWRLTAGSRPGARRPPRRRPICRPTTELILGYLSHRPIIQKILPHASRDRRHCRLLAPARSRLFAAVIIGMTTVFVSPARRPLSERIAGMYTLSGGPHCRAPQGCRASRARLPTSRPAVLAWGSSGWVLWAT